MNMLIPNSLSARSKPVKIFQLYMQIIQNGRHDVVILYVTLFVEYALFLVYCLYKNLGQF